MKKLLILSLLITLNACSIEGSFELVASKASVETTKSVKVTQSDLAGNKKVEEEKVVERVEFEKKPEVVEEVTEETIETEEIVKEEKKEESEEETEESSTKTESTKK